MARVGVSARGGVFVSVGLIGAIVLFVFLLPVALVVVGVVVVAVVVTMVAKHGTGKRRADLARYGIDPNLRTADRRAALASAKTAGEPPADPLNVPPAGYVFVEPAQYLSVGLIMKNRQVSKPVAQRVMHQFVLTHQVTTPDARGVYRLISPAPAGAPVSQSIGATA